MTTPDLTPRVRWLEEDVSAITDTVLDIKHRVDGHTRIHGEHGLTLDEHGTELAAIRGTRAEHGEALAEILRRLDRP